MKSCAEIIDIIEKRKNKGLGLDHFAQYMQGIGNPQDCLFSIHVAGTNGKGSTVNYLRAILQSAGYRVGTFTSPYLETHLDRIRINDVNIDESNFANLANRYFDDWLDADLNMFEIDMVIACLYFLEKQCDICIFEVGLGGRLDATNILKPALCAITNIGMDHMDRLGNTYAKIAMEKGGIIKADIPLLTTEQKQECLDVFQQLCVQKQTHLDQVQEACAIHYQRDHITFNYASITNIMIPTGAHYQVQNASLALAITLKLQAQGKIEIQPKEIVEGMRTAMWKGRFETIYQEPMVIVDGAHNEEGILALKETLQTFGPVRILFAALKDKETDRMLEHLLEITEDVTVTEFDFYRVKEASDIANGYPVKVEPDYQKAILQNLKDHDTPIIITGSLYFISDVRCFIASL